MKNLFLAFAVLMQISSFAQIKKVWDKSLSGPDIEDPVYIYKNGRGGVDVIAKSRGQGFDVDVAYGEHDYWFCRLDKNGQVIPGSNKSYGGTLVDFAKSAVKSSDGGYLICGVSFSNASGNKVGNLPSYNNSVLWMVKIDSVGAILWQKQVGFNGLSSWAGNMDFYRGPVVCRTTAGYAIAVNSWVTNNSNSDVMFSTHTLTLDEFGNLGTPKLISVSGYPQNNIGYSQNNLVPRYITQLSNGNLLITGYGHPAGNAAKRDGIAILCTSGGSTISSKVYTSSGPCEVINAYELSPNGDRVYFAKSQHNNTAAFSRTVASKSTTGTNDIWVFKTDNAGTLLGTGQNAIGSGGEILTDNLVVQCSDNAFYANSKAYLFLQAQNTGFDRTEAGQGSYDYWLVEYDYTLNTVTREKSFGGSGAEIPKSSYVDASSVFMLGNSYSPLSGDKSAAIKAGTWDLWVVKACLGVAAPSIANAVHKTLLGQSHWYLWPCEGYPFAFTVNNPNSEYGYKWYDAAIGGNLLASGTSYTIPNIAKGLNINVWCEATNGTCTNRSKLVISAIKTPDAPTITGSTVICSGTTLSLNGVMNTVGQPVGSTYKFRWYNSSMQIISGNTTYNRANCLSNFTLYLSVIDSLPFDPITLRPTTVCESSFTTINVVVDNAPAPIVTFTNPTCIYNPIILTVTNASGYTVKWYDSQLNLINTGNPYSWTNFNMSDVLYTELVSSLASCVSTKTTSTIVVQHAQPAQVAFNNVYAGSHGISWFPTCSGSSAIINVKTPNSAYTYKWFNAPTGGSVVNTGTSINIPNVVYGTPYQYWVVADDGTCISHRKAISVNTLKTPGTPTITTTTTNICKGDNLTLNAVKDNSTQFGGTFILRWYNSSNQLLQTGNTLTVPNIQSTATFYCAEVDSIPFNYFSGIGPFICEGPKVARQITVEVVPDPVVTFTNPVCIYNTTTLSVTNASVYTVNWYNTAGSVIHTGSSFIYQNSKMSDTLYCEMISASGCKSQKKALIINVQHSSPAVPAFQNTYTQSGIEIMPACSNSSAAISIKLPNSNYSYYWYDAPAAGNIVNVGAANYLSTVNYNANYEYWVSANDGTCISNRGPIKIKPLKTPGLPQIQGLTTHICRYDSLVLVASKDTSTQAGGNFLLRWYNASNQLLHTGDSLVIPNMLSSATYYCAGVDSVPFNYFPNLGPFICEGPKTSRQITVDTVADPIISIPSIVCTNTNIPLTVTNAVNVFIGWYNSNGNLLSSSVSYTIPHIQSTDTIYTQALGLNNCKSKKVQSIIIPQKPTADFMSPKTLLNSGDIIQFTNQSTGGNTWTWDFGDGSSSTSKNAWHYFYNPGFYNISLVATSNVGCADTITKNSYIQVGAISGVSEHSLFKDVKIYPNPFSDGIRINIPSNLSSINVSVYDLAGKKLGSYVITGEQFIPLHNLNAGVYMLRMANDDEILNIKIVKK